MANSRIKKKTPSSYYETFSKQSFQFSDFISSYNYYYNINFQGVKIWNMIPEQN